MAIIPEFRRIPRDVAQWERWLRDAVLKATNGQYTGTMTGLTTTETGTIRYEIAGAVCVLYIPAISGTSNATTCTITGGPAAIRPDRQHVCLMRITDNGTVALGAVTAETNGVLTFSADVTGGAFTASGTKGTVLTTVAYHLK